MEEAQEEKKDVYNPKLVLNKYYNNCITRSNITFSLSCFILFFGITIIFISVISKNTDIAIAGSIAGIVTQAISILILNFDKSIRKEAENTSRLIRLDNNNITCKDLCNEIGDSNRKEDTLIKMIEVIIGDK